MNRPAAQANARHEPLHLRHRNLFVGIFILIPVLVIPVFLIYSLSKSELFEHWCYLKTRFDSSYGLNKGGAVCISGTNIGYIEKVTLNNEGSVDVVFKIKRQYTTLIKKDSRAILRQKNPIVGDWSIELSLGSRASPPVQNYDFMKSEVVQLRIDETVAQLSQTLTTVNVILHDIESGKGTVGKLIVQDTLLRQVQALVVSLQKVVAQADKAAIQANQLIAQAAPGATGLLDSVKVITGNVNTLLKSVQSIVADVQKISAQSPQLYKQVARDIDNAGATLNGLQNNPLIRSLSGTPKDRMLKNDP
ncbi:MAG: MlaD family protein [Chitinivibrionales bacterium]|nr:MlaD family protein [Chitinivibrionales bacterium]